MKLDHLYRLTWTYPESFAAGDEMLLLAEGVAEGRVAGRFRGANHARRRSDGSFLPDLRGAIETVDGATIILRLDGYGFPEQGWALCAIRHTVGDERYAWLDDALCAAEVEVRGGRQLVVDVHRLVWEPLGR